MASDLDDLPGLTFQDQVRLWFELWAADAPELRASARLAADPHTDPWGYLIALGERIVARD
jgi:hypothetical protein